MPITKIAASGFSDAVNFRNIIINGDMSIAQRSTSASSVTTSGYHSCDRWQSSIGTMGTWTQSQSTDVPTGSGFRTSLKMDCTTADASPASGDVLVFAQYIEGQNLQYLKKGTSSTESLTCSFWVKSNKTGTYILELKDDNNRTINKSYTISSADTWEKKIITYAGDTSGTIDNDNGTGLELNFWLGAGSSLTSGTLQTSWGSKVNANRAVGNVNLADSTDNEWYVTGVQLEVGTSASEFEFLPHDVNLGRCQRYCYVHNNNADSHQMLVFPGASRGSTNKYFFIQHPVPMRDTPSVTLSGELRLINSHAEGYQESNDTLTIGGVDVSIHGQNANEKGVTLYYNGAITGLTDTSNMSYVMTFVKEDNNKLTMDAEL